MESDPDSDPLQPEPLDPALVAAEGMVRRGLADAGLSVPGSGEPPSIVAVTTPDQWAETVKRAWQTVDGAVVEAVLARHRWRWAHG